MQKREGNPYENTKTIKRGTPNHNGNLKARMNYKRKRLMNSSVWKERKGCLKKKPEHTCVISGEVRTFLICGM